MKKKEEETKYTVTGSSGYFEFVKLYYFYIQICTTHHEKFTPEIRTQVAITTSHTVF